ncbi:helix-turn-helix domain-containing protein [Actinomadura napierensis]|uniref:helix-turn-helix domain-containing protein n=1 Tax=Actinomadura napierensis TaxID=267854 RepID=UPI00387EE3FD
MKSRQGRPPGSPNRCALGGIDSSEERSVLTGWVRRRKTSQALALRGRIVLLCAYGATIARVAEQAGTSRNTVSGWRSRFPADRLDGLTDEPRPGRPRLITHGQVEWVVTATLKETPGADTHRSTRSTAAVTGMSQSAISRIRRAFGLKPRTVQTCPPIRSSSTRSATRSACT